MYTIESVRAEINAAFGSLPIPKTDTILGPTTGDEKGENAIKNALSGRAWQALDMAFLRESWAAFGYLSAEAYRFYLPALLARSLDDFQVPEFSLSDTEQLTELLSHSEDFSSHELLKALSGSSAHNNLLSSTLYELQPGYWSIYTKGHDEHFEYQTSLFTPEQYGAVCSFLGLVFEQLPEHRYYYAARSLWWKWNREPHPALAMAQNFYDEMHHFDWPESKNPAVRSVIAQIREGFKDTPYPADLDTNREKVQGDEPAEIILGFRGQNWRTLHPIFLDTHYTALSFLPHAAFRYFLPAFLIADLMASELEMELNGNGDPIFHLTHGIADERPLPEGESSDEGSKLLKAIEPSRQTDWYQYAMERLTDFTSQEREAVAGYLQFQIDLINDWNNPSNDISPSGGFSPESLAWWRLPIEQALERFWAQ